MMLMLPCVQFLQRCPKVWELVQFLANQLAAQPTQLQDIINGVTAIKWAGTTMSLSSLKTIRTTEQDMAAAVVEIEHHSTAHRQVGFLFSS